MEPRPAYFDHIAIEGFRRLRDVKLALGPLNVLIGANGCGKTSFLDVLNLLSMSAQSQLSSAISDLSGLSSLLTDGTAEMLRISVRSFHGRKLEYRLVLQQRAVSYVIDQEWLFSEGNPDLSIPDVQFIGARSAEVSYFDSEQNLYLRPTWDFVRSETGLAQVPKTYQVAEVFRSHLASIGSYSPIAVDRQSKVRLPQRLSPVTLPGRSGEELVSCLLNLRESHRDRFEAIEDSLRAAFPKFERLEFPPVAAGTLALVWRERGLSKAIYANELSDGTLRYLWLTTLLQSPTPTVVTLLDEPEVSLHPELLSLLADQLREASRRTQIVVATHSDTLIRFLEPSEVVVADVDDDGMTQLTRADELDLDDWLKDYSLDELWRNGRRGGRS